MSKLRHLQLEPFSFALARKILEAFPQWEPYVGRTERKEDGLMAFVLQLDVPSANRDVRQPLRIVAELDRTIYASWFPLSRGMAWHVDWIDYAFGNPPLNWREDASGFDRIVDWLRGFVAEEHVAAIWRQEDTTGLWGAFPLSDLAETEARRGRASVVRSWRGTWDAGKTPEVPLPPAIVYGDSDSRMGRLVSESLGDFVEHGFASESALPDTDRVILLDPDWSLALNSHARLVVFEGGKTRVVPPEEQGHPRLFVVRWSDAEWDGPWEEEGSFEVRDPSKDADLLRRHLLAWLREP